MTLNQTILLAVKDLKERTALSSFFADWGVGVDTSHDGDEARQKALSGNHKLILVSRELPGIDCRSLISEIKDYDKDIEVIVVSEDASVEEAVYLMRAGALDFLMSPVDLSQIKTLLERVFPSDTGSRDRGKSGDIKKYKIITKDPKMLQLLNMVEKVADSSASILIQGESGTGKELIARFVHTKSSRSKKPFIAINCAALPENLLESELFGHEKGAFTGASARKPGKFELADGGTILLDEVTEMQLHLQSKLLRVIQEKEFERIGGIHLVKVDVRVVATTNRNVKDAISGNEFREDLYYRLNTIPVRIPALRDRKADVRILSEYFIEKYNKIDGRSVKKMTPEALRLLESCSFKGNVRELENMIHRAVLLSDGNTICPGDLLVDDKSIADVGDRDQSEGPISFGFEPGPLKDMEEKMIYSTLDKTSGNRTKAAEILGISVRTLRNKLNEYKEKSEA